MIPIKVLNLLNILSMFIVFALLVVVNSKGAIYDNLMRDYNKKYSKNHSISFRNHRFHFSIPWFIGDSNNNEKIISAKNEYNKYSISFWVILILTILLNQIK